MTLSNQNNADFLFQLDEYYLDLRADGRTISFLDKQEIEQRPFPGLRPFKTSEFQLFNGRDGQAEELINRLRKNHFLAVIGSSGTGKSSLVRAGLIPQLLAGYLPEAGTNWETALCRPGKNPVENLAVALARIKSRSNDNEKLQTEYAFIKPLLSRSIYGVRDFYELLNPPAVSPAERTNLLIVVDQFEELFRFNRSDLKDPGIEVHFINLLLNASANPDVAIYVIITMRSEFLGDCAKYRGLPEAINEGQYLVPQLSREQIKEVIEDPILIAGKKIAPGLVELLVNEIEESKAKQSLDQLPILQHALMRTYQVARQANATEITYEHYLETGGLQNALANHAQTKYNELSDGSKKESFKQKIAKIIFQSLTDSSTDQKKGRRPTELRILHEIAGSIKATVQDVNDVVNHFRDTETSFIMPPSNTALYPDLIIDISHESLMRQWVMLKDWMAAETENGKMMLRLAEYHRLNKLGQKDYLGGKELQIFSTWFTKFNPQPSWAKLYTPDHAGSFTYLQESIRHTSRKKMKIAFLGLLAALGVFFAIYFVNHYQQAEAKPALLSDKRRDALKYERKLQALFFTTELLLFEKDQQAKDSIIRESIVRKLTPGSVLKQVYLNNAMVISASVSQDGDTLFTWKYDSTFSAINTLSGELMYSGKFQILQDDSYDTNLVKTSYMRLTYGDADKRNRDTMLRDSSHFYKRSFINTVLDKDEFGVHTFPTIVKNIAGAFARENRPEKTHWLTWGENTESIYSAVDLWDQYGRTAGISLVHDGVYGASLNSGNGIILTWGSDSAVKIWEENKDTTMLRMPPKLLKKKVEVDTGVELDEDKYVIKRIPYADYFKRRKEFLEEYNVYKNKVLRK